MLDSPSDGKSNLSAEIKSTTIDTCRRKINWQLCGEPRIPGGEEFNTENKIWDKKLVKKTLDSDNTMINWGKVYLNKLFRCIVVLHYCGKLKDGVRQL